MVFVSASSLYLSMSLLWQWDSFGLLFYSAIDIFHLSTSSSSSSSRTASLYSYYRSPDPHLTHNTNIDGNGWDDANDNIEDGGNKQELLLLSSCNSLPGMTIFAMIDKNHVPSLVDNNDSDDYNDSLVCSLLAGNEVYNNEIFSSVIMIDAANGYIDLVGRIFMNYIEDYTALVVGSSCLPNNVICFEIQTQRGQIIRMNTDFFAIDNIVNDNDHVVNPAIDNNICDRMRNMLDDHGAVKSLFLVGSGFESIMLQRYWSSYCGVHPLLLEFWPTKALQYTTRSDLSICGIVRVLNYQRNGFGGAPEALEQYHCIEDVLHVLVENLPSSGLKSLMTLRFHSSWHLHAITFQLGHNISKSLHPKLIREASVVELIAVMRAFTGFQIDCASVDCKTKSLTLKLDLISSWPQSSEANRVSLSPFDRHSNRFIQLNKLFPNSMIRYVNELLPLATRETFMHVLLFVEEDEFQHASSIVESWRFHCVWSGYPLFYFPIFIAHSTREALLQALDYIGRMANVNEDLVGILIGLDAMLAFEPFRQRDCRGVIPGTTCLDPYQHMIFDCHHYFNFPSPVVVSEIHRRNEISSRHLMRSSRYWGIGALAMIMRLIIVRVLDDALVVKYVDTDVLLHSSLVDLIQTLDHLYPGFVTYDSDEQWFAHKYVRSRAFGDKLIRFRTNVTFTDLVAVVQESVERVAQQNFADDVFDAAHLELYHPDNQYPGLLMTAMAIRELPINSSLYWGLLSSLQIDVPVLYKYFTYERLETLREIDLVLQDIYQHYMQSCNSEIFGVESETIVDPVSLLGANTLCAKLQNAITSLLGCTGSAVGKMQGAISRVFESVTPSLFLNVVSARNDWQIQREAVRLLPLDRCHFVTIATRNVEQFQNLQLSAELAGVTLEVLGMGDEENVDMTRSFKARHVWRYLQNPNLEEDDVVVFFDAYDVLLFPPIRRITKLLAASATPVITCAEHGLLPSVCPAFAWPYRRGALPEPQIIGDEGLETCPKFLNSGCIAGRVKEFRLVWHELFVHYDLNFRTFDQVEMQFVNWAAPHLVSLDIRSQMFVSGYRRFRKQRYVMHLASNLSFSVDNGATRAIPLMHFNGNYLDYALGYNKTRDLLIGYHVQYLRGKDGPALLAAIHSLWDEQPLNAIKILLRSSAVVHNSTVSSNVLEKLLQIVDRWHDTSNCHALSRIVEDVSNDNKVRSITAGKNSLLAKLIPDIATFICS